MLNGGHLAGWAVEDPRWWSRSTLRWQTLAMPLLLPHAGLPQPASPP